MIYAHISGTGSSLPERILTNPELQEIVDTSDDWITRRTGIKERRIASPDRNESTTDLAVRAAIKALAMAKVPADQIDSIVVGTVTPDRQFPSTACMVQKELKACDAAAMDVSAGCSGFLYALTVARNAICCGTSKTALVIGVERLSSIVNWQDRSTCVLLGDGAGAVVLRATDKPGGIFSCHLKSDGASWDLLFSDYGNNYIPEILQPLDLKPFHLKMTGNRLFKQAVGCLTAIARQALEHNGLTIDDIDLVIPHQANIRIINAMTESLDIPPHKVFTNVHKYGNTSSASIPIALDEAQRDNLLSKEKIALLISFGAGLTWGAVVVKWAI